MGRRRKMTLWDLLDIGVEYHSFSRMSLKSIRGKKVYGRLYELDKLTDKQRKAIQAWKNTMIASWQTRYAPEINGDAVWLASRCIR